MCLCVSLLVWFECLCVCFVCLYVWLFGCVFGCLFVCALRVYGWLLGCLYDCYVCVVCLCVSLCVVAFVVCVVVLFVPELFGMSVCMLLVWLCVRVHGVHVGI